MGNIGERLQSYFRASNAHLRRPSGLQTVSCNLFCAQPRFVRILAQPGSLKTPWIVADSELILPPTVAREQANALEDRGYSGLPSMNGRATDPRLISVKRWRIITFPASQRIISKLKSVFAGTIVFLSISSKILSRIHTNTFMPP